MNIFYQQIYALVKKIPKGLVAPYGQIGAVLGRPRAAREVGRAIRVCPSDNIPWQRVVMADGTIAGEGEFALLRRKMLAAEGVHFTPTGKVNMEKSAIELAELELIALIALQEVGDGEDLG